MNKILLQLSLDDLINTVSQRINASRKHNDRALSVKPPNEGYWLFGKYHIDLGADGASNHSRQAVFDGDGTPLWDDRTDVGVHPVERSFDAQYESLQVGGTTTSSWESRAWATEAPRVTTTTQTYTRDTCTC